MKDAKNDPRLTTIALLIEVPSTRVWRRVMPPGNWVGTRILAKLLLSALVGADVQVSASGFAGGLSSSFFFYRVADRDRSLAVVREELAAVSLIEFSHVGWFCASEGIWRPNASAAPDLFNDAVWEWFGRRAVAETARAIEALRAAERDLIGSAGSIGGSWRDRLSALLRTS